MLRVLVARAQRQGVSEVRVQAKAADCSSGQTNFCQRKKSSPHPRVSAHPERVHLNAASQAPFARKMATALKMTEPTPPVVPTRALLTRTL